MKKLFIPFVFAAAVSFVSCDSNTNTTADNINDSIKEQNKETTTVENESLRFAEHAALGSLFEIESGKLAAEKAANPDVKAFGQQMVDDHTKISDDLKNVASSKNITLPTLLDGDQQKDMDELRNNTGNDFDKKYLKMMVKDHENDVKKFQDASVDLKDVEIRNFAQNHLVTLQNHYNKVRALDSTINK